MKTIWTLVASAATAVLVPFAPAQSQTLADEYVLAIDQQPLVATLKEFSRQTGLQVLGIIDNSEDAHRIVGPLKGTYTAEAALVELLENSALVFKRINRNTIAVTQRERHTRETTNLLLCRFPLSTLPA